jgi:hypothetical protein
MARFRLVIVGEGRGLSRKLWCQKIRNFKENSGKFNLKVPAK